jgi:hypothetical protein
MNKSTYYRGIGKYTRYLIFGNFFHCDIRFNEKSFFGAMASLFILIRTITLLGFSVLLFPFALALDTGRLFYFYEIMLSRKVKQYSLIYKFRRGTINLVYRGGRFAYLLMQKTDFFIQQKS